MGYNYFKVVLKLFAAQREQQAAIIEAYRRSTQQAQALTREMRESVMRARHELTK
jgi:virulence-associated protein VagC